jgi:hypothetical protein
MSDPSTASAPLAGAPPSEPGGDREDLQRELDRRGAEILRLRDLLLVKEAELGAVKGQLAELENVSRGLMMAAGRIQRRLPWAMRLARALLRPVLRPLLGRSGRRGGG